MLSYEAAAKVAQQALEEKNDALLLAERSLANAHAANLAAASKAEHQLRVRQVRVRQGCMPVAACALEGTAKDL